MLNDIYLELRNRELVRSGREFSRVWCGRSGNYLCETVGRAASPATAVELARRLLARIMHQGWRAWRKPLIGHRIRLRDLNPADVGAHARQA